MICVRLLNGKEGLDENTAVNLFMLIILRAINVCMDDQLPFMTLFHKTFDDSYKVLASNISLK